VLEFGVQDGDVSAALVPPLVQVGLVRVEESVAVEGLGDQVLGAGGLGEAAHGRAVQAQPPRDLPQAAPVGL
jgi:hypothetical protein